MRVGGVFGGLVDRLLFRTIGFLGHTGQFARRVRVRLRFLRVGRIDGTGAALRRHGQSTLSLLRLQVAQTAIEVARIWFCISCKSC